MSGRIMHMAVRLTLNKANDNPMMQELSFDGMNGDGRKIVERIQAFGMSSMPLPRDEDKQQQGGGGAGGTGGDGEQPKGPAAEGIALFLGGQRNHPVVIAVDDRRHRPMGLKGGESAQYDDQGQMTLIRRNGLFMVSLDDDNGDGTAPGQYSNDGQKKERMVSLRHVQKKKQERKKSGQGGGGGASAGTREGGQQQAANHEDYKHEGETVNTEVRATKNKIEILDGETVVATYDKQAKSWTFESANKMTIKCSGGPTEIWGKPIKFNGGGTSTQPFEVPG
ncbi:phage baseplate assembly protein [Bradyrhizobium sp. BRP22]|uniref:phage baseplate assembly protein n=1 Tax=Bradyrhizobium sp. BRP22 TaxID=2793821 RepID=UPI001CD527AC|nr:phage baseplate assembly protein [Bradyrhizobium sp. BRP22]MCA1452830.1 phage baseplate assembly protein [Bradyrhizobium sp. BRP22]